MEIKFLRPAQASLRVPMPERPGSQLPKDGQDVVMTDYWQRRLLAEEVVEGPKPTRKRTREEAPDEPADPASADPVQE
jgi:hypothetical protein